MKIKDYLEKLSPNEISGIKGLVGKQLKILEPYFENIDELKGKKIEIIEELTRMGEPIIKKTSTGVSVEDQVYPKLLTVKNFDCLSDNIKLYSIFLENDEVIVRCSEDSIYLDIQLPPFEDIDEDGNYIGDDPNFL